EVLHAVTERDGAVTDVAPSALRLRLRRLAGLFQLLAGVLGAFLDRLADALRGLFDAFTDVARADLLRPGLDLVGGRLHLRVVGGARRRGRANGHRQRSQDCDRVPHSVTSLSSGVRLDGSSSTEAP